MVSTPVEQVLDNGLRLVVVCDHTAPVVAVNVWYGVGSRHEEPTRTGFAHLFEHLMFQGSSQVASGEHFSLLQGVGAALNGTTAQDRTNYFETVPRHALDLALWLEADRMGSLLEALTQANLDNQRDVVKNERRQRYDNVPYGTAWERLFAAVFPAGHPYHHLPIGSMEHLDAASLEDVHAFFHRWYAPDNAVVSVVGDVTAVEARDLAEKYFGGIPARGAFPPAPDGTIDVMDAQVRIDVRDEAVPAASIYVGVRAPVDGSIGCDAMHLAINVLAEGASSRLFTRLVREEQVVSSIQAYLQRLVGGASVAAVQLRVMPGIDPALVEALLAEELTAFCQQGPTQAELARAKAQAEREALDAISTVGGLADELSRCTTLFGDPLRATASLDQLLAVDARTVHEVAARCFAPNNQVVLTYHLPQVDLAEAGA
jgi:predicted Zn-dependent peptidase